MSNFLIVMLNVIMLSVVMLCVVILNVVAPFLEPREGSTEKYELNTILKKKIEESAMGSNF
jgi:hypothetical protein